MYTFNDLLKIFSFSLLCMFVSTYPMISPREASSDDAHITPLHRAAFEGHDEAVERLLKMGADVKARNCFGRTPLHDAVVFGSPKIITLLLAYGADPNVIDHDGMTPLFKAVQQSNTNAVQLLLENGADANQYVKGITPLHQATYDSHLEVIQLLLAHGAAINAQNMFGRTPLHDVFEGHGYCPEVVQTLLHANADLTMRDHEEKTPLFAAINLGDLAADCVKLLLAYGANPNIYARGITPLHNAAFNAHCRIATLLCEYGAEINALNFSGKTPLHDALDGYYNEFPSYTSKSSRSIIEFLVKHGARPDITDHEGRTPKSIDQAGIIKTVRLDA